jgi:hypothetical protein
MKDKAMISRSERGRTKKQLAWIVLLSGLAGCSLGVTLKMIAAIGGGSMLVTLSTALPPARGFLAGAVTAALVLSMARMLRPTRPSASLEVADVRK